MSKELEIARLKFLETHASLRAKICYLMIGAGIACLISGIVMLIVGLTAEQVVWFESGTIKITAGGFGAVTMVASAFWGYAAYKSRPLVSYKGTRSSDKDEFDLSGLIIK